MNFKVGCGGHDVAFDQEYKTCTGYELVALRILVPPGSRGFEASENDFRTDQFCHCWSSLPYLASSKAANRSKFNLRICIDPAVPSQPTVAATRNPAGQKLANSMIHILGSALVLLQFWIVSIPKAEICRTAAMPSITCMVFLDLTDFL